MNSSSPRYSPTPPAPNLGDFGTLLRYLELEKQKWLAIDPSADISSLFPTSSSHPPKLPHSSSSEYSSDEEMIERTIKAVQKRVRVLLHPSDDISSGNEKEKREGANGKRKRKKKRKKRGGKKDEKAMENGNGDGNGNQQDKQKNGNKKDKEKEKNENKQVLKKKEKEEIEKEEVQEEGENEEKKEEENEETSKGNMEEKDQSGKENDESTEEKMEKHKKVHFDSSPPQVVHFTPSFSQAVISSPKQKQKPKPLLPTPSSGNSTPIPIPIQLSEDPIHVFIDNSNILMGFYSYYRGQLARNSKSRKVAGNAVNPVDSVNLEAQNQPKLSYDALFTILERGRNVTRKVLVASSPLYQDLTEAEAAGYEVSILKRVMKPNSDETHDARRRGQYTSIEREQCVDELLHLKILQSLLEYHPPATLVLASGDGKDGEYFQGGFRKCIVMALDRGWKVEIISWQHQLSYNFLQPKFLHKWKGLYHVVFLDWFAKELGCTY